MLRVFPPPSLYDTRVVLHGRLSLIKAELDDLDDQLKRLPSTTHSWRLLSKRHAICVKVEDSMKTSLCIIDAAARHQREVPRDDLVPVSDIFKMDELTLCEYVQGVAMKLAPKDLPEYDGVEEVSASEEMAARSAARTD